MSRPYNPEYIESAMFDDLEEIDRFADNNLDLVPAIFDDYTVDELYRAGVIGASYLFDNPEDDLEASELYSRITVMNSNDSAFSRKLKELSPDSSFMKEVEWQKKIGLVRVGIESRAKLDSINTNLSPSDKRDLMLAIDEGHEAQTEIFYSMLRFGDWFTRESMGLHKVSNQATGKKPVGSSYRRGKNLDVYASRDLDYSDRLQVVLIALWESIQKSAETGEDFSLSEFRSFTFSRMEWALTNEIDNCSYDSVCRIPISRRQQFRWLARNAIDAEEVGDQVLIDDLAYELSLPQRDSLITDAEKKKFSVEVLAERMVQLSSVSLEYLQTTLESPDFDDPYLDDEDSLQLGDRIAQLESGEFDSVLKSVALEDLMIAFRQALGQREYQILVARCGINGDSPKTQKQIGEEWMLSSGRISAIEAKTLTTLRHSVKHLWDIGRIIISDFDNNTHPEEEVLRLSREEVEKLGLKAHIAFNRSPSTKYRVRDSMKRFVYQEDWTDDDIVS